MMKKLILGIFISLSVFAATDSKLNTTYLFMKEPSPGENKVTIVPPALSTDYTLTLPTSAGSPGYVLKTDGSGLLTWENPTAGGTVTEVHMSTGPNLTLTTTTAGTIADSITTYGTFNISLSNQSASIVLAGPTSGSGAAPTFRSLDPTDIPNLDASKITTGKGALTTSTTGVTVTTGSNALFTSAAVDIQTATGAQPGLLSAADWTAFNGKGYGTVTGVYGGTGLSANPSPIVGAGTLSIANTGVTAATYGAANSVPIITLNAQGQVTAVSSGAITTTGTVTSVTAGTGLSGGPVTTTGTLSIAATGVTSGTYGSTTVVPVITLNAQGQVTGISSGTISAASLTMPAVNTYTSGSQTGTYVFSGSYSYIRVTGCGGGGGGGGGGNTSSTGGIGGGSTIFGPSITAAGGSGGGNGRIATGIGTGGNGGSPTISGSIIIISSISGAAGSSSTGNGNPAAGGQGGIGPFGGNSTNQAGWNVASTAGVVGTCNGGNGGDSGTGGGRTGGGGGAGAFFQVYIQPSLNQTFNFTVGAGGTAGAGEGGSNGSSGAAGSSGRLTIEAF